MEDRMTKEQLLHELEEMRRQVTLLDKCGMEMQTLQAKYEKLLESTPDAMLFINQEARIVLANAQAEKLFGYSEEELVGKDLHLLVPDRYRLQHKNKVADYFSNPGETSMKKHLLIAVVAAFALVACGKTPAPEAKKEEPKKEEAKKEEPKKE